MKPLYTFLLIFLCAFTKVNAQADTKTTVLVIDKSELIEDTEILQKRLERVQTIIWENCTENGDKIIVSYIFEGSGNITNKNVYTLSLPSLKTENLSPLKKKQMQKKLLAIKRQKRIDFVRDVSKKALNFNKERPRSHILDLLVVLDQIKSSYGAFNLYIISDLIEFSPYRNLHKTKLHSTDHAKRLGTVDSKKVAKKFGLNRPFLKDIPIKIFFPVGELENRPVFEFLPYYWQAVLSLHGSSNNLIDFDKL